MDQSRILMVDEKINIDSEINQKIQDEVAKAQFPVKLGNLFKPSRYKVLYGGRGGSKSWGIARTLLIKGTKIDKPIRVLCAREYQTSIKDSVHKLLCDQITSLGLMDFYEITQTSIRGQNGTEFAFIGLKNNPANIKSFEGVDICWVEEAQTVSRLSWNILIPTIRKQGSEIWVSFNPELEADATYQRFVVDPPRDCISIKINWYDNPWFPETLAQEKDALKIKDPEAYKQVWEGLCRQTVDGAIFGKELGEAEKEGRLTKVPYDPLKPVHAICDLGWADATAWWFVQFIGMETRLIRYFEDVQRTMTSYLSQLQTFGYVYETIWLPHDAKSKTIAAAGRSIEDIVRSSGYKTRILDRVPVMDSINAARTIFQNCYFDRENCADGLNCLRRYRYFGRTPFHDQYSHGADAFRYIALMLKEPAKAKKKLSVSPGVGWMG